MFCFFFFCINEIKRFFFLFLDTIGVYNRLACVSLFSSFIILTQLFSLVYSHFLPFNYTPLSPSFWFFYCLYFLSSVLFFFRHLKCYNSFAFVFTWFNVCFLNSLCTPCFFFYLFLFTSFGLFPAPLFTSSLPLRKNYHSLSHTHTLTFSRQLSKTVGHFLCLHHVYPLITFPKAFRRSHFIKLFPHLAATSIAKIS